MGGIFINKIVPKFKDSLFLDASNIIQDYAEIGIDSFLDNDIVKEIPIVKSLVAAKRITNNIADRVLLRNLILFINELNSGNIDKKKLAKHLKTLENPKKSERELGRFLIILNQTFDNEKALLYGKIYKSYINQIISWDDVVEFSEIVYRIFIPDLKILNDLYLGKSFVVSNFTPDRLNMFRIDRLYSLGIIGYFPKADYPGGGIESYAKLNKLGKTFAGVIFK